MAGEGGGLGLKRQVSCPDKKHLFILVAWHMALAYGGEGEQISCQISLLSPPVESSA